MRWCLSTPGSREYVHPVAQSTSITPVSPSSLPRSLTMYLEAVIKRVEWCSWRPGSSELRDALGDRDWVNPEMHREAGIERVWGCTCRLWSSGIGGVHASGRFGGRRDGSRDSIHLLTCNCQDVESWVQQHPPRGGRLAWSRRLSIVGWCSTWSMLYSVWSHDNGMER